MKTPEETIEKLIIEVLAQFGEAGSAKTPIVHGGYGLNEHPEFVKAGQLHGFNRADLTKAFDRLIENGTIVCLNPPEKSGKKTYALNSQLLKEYHQREATTASADNTPTLAEQIANAMQENELKTARAVSDAYRDHLLGRSGQK